MQRITVSNLINLGKTETILLSPNSFHIQFRDFQTFILKSNGQLCIHDLTNGKEINLGNFKQQLSQNQAIKLNVAFFKNIVAFSFKHSAKLFTIDLSNLQKSIQIYECHMRPITSIINYQEFLVTGSQDYTIKFWQKGKKQKNLKNPFSVLTHTNAITCFETYGTFLFSGSKDKTLKCWTNEKQWATFKFEEPIVKIFACPSSQQLLVCTEDSKINFMSIVSILKKTTQIQGVLTFNQGFSENLCGAQINQQFFILGNKRALQFIEVNLVKKIHRIEECFCESGQINSINFKKKSIFCGCSKNGVSLLKI